MAPRRRRTSLAALFVAILLASAFCAQAAAQPEKDAAREFAPASVLEGKPRDRGHAYGKQFREAICDFLQTEIDAAFIDQPSTKEQMLRYAAACGEVVRAPRARPRVTIA